MKTPRKFVLFTTFFAMFLLSCSKDDPSDVLVKEGPFKISELAGNWEANRAYFSDGNLNSVDVVGEGGTVTLAVQGSGRFSMTIDPADRAAYTVGGEMFWEPFEGKYYFAIEWDKYKGDWDTYGATLDVNIFSFNGGFDSGEYDFDNDGTFEATSISCEFERI
jgi:hypothetical protein